ncbi:MAG: hypothetical protein K9M98_14585 [Cephaloticoccus sp.]|nr:hypothetical protein [Cephaloticoccus sp.]MCF7761723.1 hypothetical protein [Cephaloticoccus sp.]
MTSLWLPILLSAVFVFILSGVLHMALPWHKNDFKKVPDEDKLRDVLRPLNVPPGDYTTPMCEGGNYYSPEFKAKIDAGPNVLMTVLPNGQCSMGLTFVQWFVFLIVIGIFTSYVAMHAVPAEASARAVFRLVGAVSFLAYAGAQWPQSIWMRRSWCSTIKHTIDGLLYALVTAATFAWLWPE